MKGDLGIVLIHGAGLGSFIWDEIKPMLDIPVLAIDFPNRNKGEKANTNLPFEAYTKSVIEQIEKWKKIKIILVVHSIGGCIGLKLAEHFKGDLAGFVAISASLPPNGQSFVSDLPFPKSILMPIVLRLFGTKPPKKLIEKELCNDLTPEQTEKVVNNFTPESTLLYTTNIRYKKPEVKMLYIKSTNDNSLPVFLQDKMINNLSIQRVEIIDGGHLLMLSHPKQLLNAMNKFIFEIKITNG